MLVSLSVKLSFWLCSLSEETKDYHEFLEEAQVAEILNISEGITTCISWIKDNIRWYILKKFHLVYSLGIGL